MTDIMVTSPKAEMLDAAYEAAECIAAGGGMYYRNTKRMPKDVKLGDRIWYVEDGYIRGFAVIVELLGKEQSIAGQDQNFDTHFIVSDATTWTWIKPIPMRGFQGWRYGGPTEYEIVGDWLAARPEV